MVVEGQDLLLELVLRRLEVSEVELGLVERGGLTVLGQDLGWALCGCLAAWRSICAESARVVAVERAVVVRVRGVMDGVFSEDDIVNR